MLSEMLVLAVVSTLAVAFGLLPMPFGYYTLLRVVLCLTGAIGVAAAKRRDDAAWVWAYATLVVLYNPILPVKLGAKSLWIGLNMVSLALLWLGALRFRHSMR